MNLHPRRGLRASWSARLSALVVLSLVLCACGHPASESECREILRKSAELELKTRLDQDKELIAKELAGIEESMKGSMMKECVGKRITDSTLECVRKADSSTVLFEECLH